MVSKAKSARGAFLSRGDRVFYTLNAMFLIGLFVVIAYPLVYILSSSFSSAQSVARGRVILWPAEWSVEGYEKVFSYGCIYTGYLNSMIYTVVGTVLGLILTFVCAFPLSRRQLIGRKWLTLIFIIPLYFTGGMVPTYLLVNQLGLYNTRMAVILPIVVSSFNMLVARTYFTTTIPDELYEYAQLDGCDDFQFLFKIVLPLSTTIIAVLALFYAIRYWNNFLQAFMYLSKSEMYPLQLVLREVLLMTQSVTAIDATILSAEEISKNSNMYELVKYCVIVVASLPIILCYPFVQRYFVKGVMMGSVKG